jgi:hypothetical protein
MNLDKIAGMVLQFLKDYICLIVRLFYFLNYSEVWLGKPLTCVCQLIVLTVSLVHAAVCFLMM